MNGDSFKNKIECEYAIITNGIDYQFVTKILDIKPDRCFNKGDEVISKHTKRVGIRPHGLWALRSKTVICDDINISEQIVFFQEKLEDKIELIENRIKKEGFECLFRISIETEDAGAGFDLCESELVFISRIATRYSCMFIAKDVIKP